MKKNILLVFGTRPEAIKMAPLALELKQVPEFEVKILVTAQHRTMLDQVLNLFRLKPDFDLDLMKPNQTLGSITAKILEGTEAIFKSFRPDLVCVHGDTTTSFAASLAAFYHRIDVAHVEAGLRTHNIYSPFPEEFNRQVTSKVTKFHFAPTELSKQNLVTEGVPSAAVCVTGNTVIDALLWSLDHRINEAVYDGIDYNFSDRPFILITGHRRENFGDGFVNICRAIRDLSQKFPGHDFIYPVHLNPNVQGPVNEILAGLENVFLLEPQEYLPFVALMKRSKLILTDSGGVQEEAPSLGKPVLVMRDTTERPEAVEAGTVRLVGSSHEKIVAEVSLLLEDPAIYAQMQRAHNPYGDGKASQRIVEFLRKNLT